MAGTEAPFFEPLTARDAWFLYAERPETPLDLGTVYVFEGDSQVPGGRGALGIEQTIKERIHLVPRYRQRILGWPKILGERFGDPGGPDSGEAPSSGASA